MHRQPDNHHVRRIVLPSGRTIDVVRFEETGEARRPPHVCARCDSELVQPVAWSEGASDRWDLVLECPNCWWTEEGSFDRDAVHGLEERLDEGLARMLADLRKLAHANMTEEINRFVAALRADVILPEDF